MGKELLEFTEKLGGQGFIGGYDQGWPLDLGHYMGHGKGLARSGDAEEHLTGSTAFQAAHQCGYGLGLVAGGGKGADKLKGTIHGAGALLLLSFKFQGLDGKMHPRFSTIKIFNLKT
jgi:hypothetical protein